MPTSRSRRARNVSATTRKRQHQQRARRYRDEAAVRSAPARDASIGHCTGPFDGDVLRALLEEFTEADWQALEECRRHEALGDARAALTLRESTPWAALELHDQGLRELVALGTEVPQWVLCRWVVEQAHRWLLAERDPRIEVAVTTTITTAYVSVDLEQPLGMDWPDFYRRVCVSDWIAAQLALHDSRGLSSYVEEVAAASLRGRVPLIEQWAVSPVCGYSLLDVVGETLLVVDLATGELVELLNLGLTWSVEPGSCVLGRLVPTGTSPSWMFAGLPLEVDAETARAVATSGDDPTAWLRQLAVAFATGGLPAGASLRRPVSLVSDIPGGPPWGLDGAGATGDAAAGVELCAFVLEEVDSDPESAGHLAPVLMSVLLEEAVLDRLRIAGPGDGEAWSMIGDCLPEPFRRRCLEIALIRDEDPAA